MGAGGVPNRTIKIVNGKRGDLPTSGAKTNSGCDLYVNGEKVQSRWFDSKGNVIRNRDYNHQNAHNNHEFPHDHNWSWDNGYPQRNRENLKPNFDIFN